MNVSGSDRRVECCKEPYKIDTWNIRLMNQGNLDVVMWGLEMLNIDILGISELKLTGMGEFNSDNHKSTTVSRNSSE